MQEDDKILKAVTRVFIAIFIIIFITIMMRFLAKNVLVDIVKTDNPIIQEIAEDGGSKESKRINIDWNKEYPVDEKMEKDFKKNNIINDYNNLVNNIKILLEKYSGDFLFGYEKIVELSKKYEKTINWNLIAFDDNDIPIYIDDGYWSNITKKENYNGNAQSIVDFNNYLKEKGIKLLYVQAPKKTQNFEGEVSNIYKDYSYENIDNVIKILNENNVETLDLRKKIIEEQIETKSLFYKTDHHWTPRAAIWAMRYISDEMNKRWNMNINSNLYNLNNYYTVTMVDEYLGSEGRKITLSKALPENFDIILPAFENEFIVDIPELGIKEYKGNIWNTLFDRDCLEIKDYYSSQSYDTYGYNNMALIHIKNNKIMDNEKILLLADSFSGALSPYLALGVEEVYRIDLRDFKGSIKSFIDKNEITKVIMLYYPDSFSNEESKALFEYN